MRNSIEGASTIAGMTGGLAAITLTIASLAGSAANAADLRPAYKAPPPPPPPAFSWTGCYIGGNAGWIGNNSRATTSIGEAGFPALTVANSTYTYNLDDSGFIGGVQYGCQQQFGQWVVGLDSDFDFTNLKENITVSHAARPGVAAYTENLTQDLSWNSNTRLRLGYSWDRWMVFAAGGLASGRVKSSYFLQPAGVGFDYVGSDSKTRYGWTIGGGLEYALTDNWFLRGEYLYIDLGSRDYFSAISTSTPGNPSFWNTDIDTRAHIVRAALSYRFTTAPGLWQWAQSGFRY